MAAEKPLSFPNDAKPDEQKESEKNSNKVIHAIQNVQSSNDNNVNPPHQQSPIENVKPLQQQQKETKTPKIISRMQNKDLKPTLQTCPLSNENRIKLKKESPFYINMEEMCTPEKLLRLEMEKIPAKAPFKSDPPIGLRQIFKGYGNFKLVIQPLWYHFKESNSFLNVNFQSFARTNLILKMIITNPKNFHVRPKIKELKPLEKGSFELHFCKEKIVKTPYNMLAIGWMSKEKYQIYKKTKMDFFDFSVSDSGMGGMFILPVTNEDFKDELNNHESTNHSKESMKIESKNSKPEKKIKATTPFESSCSRVTTTHETSKQN